MRWSLQKKKKVWFHELYQRSENRKGEYEVANIYLTESSLLLDDKIKRLLQQDGRKEKILQVFFTKGETITYDQVETISLAGQKTF